MKKFINKITELLQDKRYCLWLVIGFYFLLAILALRGIIFSGQTIGLRHDWFIPENSEQIQSWVKEALYPWSDKRLGIPVSYWSDIVLRFSLGLISFLGANGPFFSVLIIIISFVGAGFFSYQFLKTITQNSPLALLTGSFFYAFNPLVFNKIISGHIYYLLAYAFSPLFLLLIYRSHFLPLKSRQFWFYLLSAGLIFAFCGTQTQFVILLFLAYIIIAIIHNLSWKKLLFNLLIIGVISFFIHLSWLVVFFASSYYYQNPIGVSPSTYSWFVYNSSLIYQGYFLLGGATDYFSRSLISANLFPLWLSAAAFIILFLLFNLKNSDRPNIYHNYFKFFLLSVIFLAIFTIIPEILFQLVKESLLINIFREIYHAAFLVALLISILITLAINKFNLKPIIKILVVVALFIASLPFFIDGRLLNNLQTFNFDQSYQNYVDTNHRILFLPSVQPLKYFDLYHSGIDPSIYYSSAPSLSQITSWGSMTDRFNTFFQSELYFNSNSISQVLEKYLELFDVQNIIYRPEFQSDLAKFTMMSDYPSISTKLTNNQLLSILKQYSTNIIQKSSDWIIYKFNNNSQKMDLPTVCESSGSWQNLNQLFTLTGPAACNGVFFAKDSDYRNNSEKIDNVIINDNNWLDYLINNSENTVLEPGVFANQTMNPKENWIAGSNFWWYDPQFAAYSRLFAATSAKNTDLAINISSLDQQEYYLFADVFYSPEGDSIEFNYQDYHQSINTFSRSTTFNWTNLGLIKIQDQNNKFIITNIAGTNAVGLIMFIPAGDYQAQTDRFVEYYTSHNQMLMSAPAQNAVPAGLKYNLNNQPKFYANFPEYSQYEFHSDSDKLEVKAVFNGGQTQDEYATIIYPLDQINIHETPVISVETSVDNQDIQFWEIGFEIDYDNDHNTDDYVWSRLVAGSNYIDLAELMNNQSHKIELDQCNITAIRFQPHKEYNIDMNILADHDYKFGLENLYFYTRPESVVRFPRQTNQFDLDKLLANPSRQLNLSDGIVNLYNDVKNTTHHLERSENNITIQSQFTNQTENNEFANIIIYTDIDLNFYHYFTANLQIENPDIQYYDLAFGFDTNGDDTVEQFAWVDSIYFSPENNSQTIFYDLINLLRQKTIATGNQRLIQIQILPHRQYKVDIENMPSVNFSISDLAFYHEAAIQSVQHESLPTFRSSVYSPIDDEYQLYINLDSNQAGQLAVALSGQNYAIDLPANAKHQWFKVGAINLEKGDNDIALITYNQSFIINQLAFFNFNHEINQNNANNQISNIKKINPVLYQADIHIETPTYLRFKESYHPAWQLSLIDSKTNQLVTQIKPEKINSWQQAFYIEDAGDYRLEISYQLTSIYQICLRLSAIFAIFLIILIIIL